MTGLNRTGWLAVLCLGAIGVGFGWRRHWPSPSPALPCGPEEVEQVNGVAVCRALGQGGVGLPAGPSLTLGRKLDLNRATVDELALLPGIGPSLATRLVAARVDAGHFASWDEVDAVNGVGPGKLQTLREATQLAADVLVPKEQGRAR